MIVRTFAGVQALTTGNAGWANAPASSLELHGIRQAYADIYRTQPNVRICVDFLARNIAQLTQKAYRRISDTDRVHLPGHELMRWLAHPNPATTSYRLKESLVADLAIYFNAYWLKVRHRGADGKDAIGLVRLPPEQMRVDGGLLPTGFVWTANGVEKPFQLSEIVYFNGYNPCNERAGLAPLETLRNILAEESAVSENRKAFWRNSSRMEGVWEIEKDSIAARWTDAQKRSWREQWQEFATSARAGQTALGPPGATYKDVAFSAKDSEYTLGGKLRREVCAAAYHIPQPMVGILDHATFSNIKEQHKHLYADTLGPWLEMIVQEIERQLLIECDDQQDVYTEFNIAGKLAGSFEEQASALQMSVGRPWQTVNEARAKQNLPRDPDPESDRIAPQQGGPASNSQPDDAETTAAIVEPVIRATRLRQRARLAKLPAEDRAAAFAADLDRWNRELSADLARVTGAADEIVMAAAVNTETLRRLEAEAHG